MLEPSSPEFVRDNADFEQAYRYWQGLRTGSSLPTRAQIRFSDLGDLSLRLYLVQWQGPADLRIIFSGLDGVAIAGKETIGLNHFANINSSLVPHYSAASRQIRDWPCGVVVDFYAGSACLSWLYLPLEQSVTEGPYGFTVLNIDLERLGGLPSLELLQAATRLHIRTIDVGNGVPWPEKVISG